jgi:probable DNA metabolism protein
MNYIYDGSFEGFLTCVWHHYRSERAARIIPLSLNEHEQQWQPDFINKERLVESDSEKAGKVAGAIVKKISNYDLERIYRAFCTDASDKEMKLLNYIVLGLKKGSRIRLMHSDPIVFAVQKEEQRLGIEVHRLCGLIRFSAVNAGERTKLLYAPIAPDNEVLEFLAPHFTARFHSDPFIIHDVKREKALAAYNREWHITEFSSETAASLKNSPEENRYRELWKHYFDIIAIKERTNSKCQRRFMPVRYWGFLTEKDSLF